MKDVTFLFISIFEPVLRTNEGSKIEKITSQFGLPQLINEPTHVFNETSCIDLLFTTQPNLVTESGVHSSLHSHCHHQIVFS